MLEEFNTKMLNHLRGMFSFVIWDKKKKFYLVQEISLVLNLLLL